VVDEFQRAKDLLRKTCEAFDDAGNDFERMCEQLLREVGFFNVRRQFAGQQFGRDFTADLDDPEEGEPTHWFLECKNVVDVIGTRLVAPKLMWHLSSDRLTGGFVIVGASKLSNELHELLERTDFPFSIFNWTDDNFVKLVAICLDTQRRWFPGMAITPSSDEAAGWRAHLFRAASAGYEMLHPLRAAIAPRYDPPFEYAYFFRDGRFEKWPADVGFVHFLRLFNACRWPLVVRSIALRTLAFDTLPARVLVLNKPKGHLEPLRLKYIPVQAGGRDVEVLAPNAIQLVQRETATHFLELDGPAKAGSYVLQVLVTYDGQGHTHVVEGPLLRVCVCSSTVDNAAADPANRLRLHVWRKHYDHLARRVLELPGDEWERLNATVHPDFQLTLGPTAHDDLQRRPAAWRIQRVSFGPREAEVDGSTTRTEFDRAEVLLDLGEVPGETRPRDPYEQNERTRALYGLTQEELAAALSGGQVRLPTQPKKKWPSGWKPRRRHH
jgi:hypothetical protein